MSHSKRDVSLLLALLAIVIAAACSPATSNPNTNSVQPALPDQSTAPTAITIDASALPTDDFGEPIVARVNGDVITLAEYQRNIARYQQEPLANPGAIPKMVLDTLVQQRLIEQAAAANNVVVTTEEVDQELQGLIESAGGAGNWQQWLSDNLYTEAELRDVLHNTLLTNRVRDHVTSDLNGNVAQVHARHILVATQDQANQLLARLRAGEDFAALAAANSLDTSTKDSGGDLGWFTQEELLEPALAQVAFQLEPGQIAGPVQSSLGWHIIQTLERGVRPIDPAKLADLSRTRFEKWLETLTMSAKIETYL